MSSEITFFLGFTALVVFVLALDLGVFNKKDHIIGYREAAAWTTLWVVLSLVACLFLRLAGEQLHGIETYEQLEAVVGKYKPNAILDPGNFEASLQSYRNAISLEFITGYLVEYSLSVDNIFVIILIFSAFGVEKRLYHRVLFWGIIGAVAARFIFIFFGGFLILKFGWILYVFAGFLIFSGIKMFLARNAKDEIDPQHHPVVVYASKLFKVHSRFEGNKFFVFKEGKRHITPLFLVLLVIEFSDIIFAVDSIPAIFAITRDTYIVFFSNIFAILGLRSLFFLLINFMDKLRYFKHGLAVLLIFIGLKMLLEEFLHGIGFSQIHALGMILFIIGLSVALSLVFPASVLEENGR